MSMALNPETLTLNPNPGQATGLWRQWGWPACATMLVHGLALGTLMLNWAPVAPAPTLVPNSVSLTLMSAPMPMPPMPEPIIEPPPVAEPVIEASAPEPVIDQAAIARERRAREQERERQQMLERQQAEREREQQRQQVLQRQQELAQQAEQARMAAEQQALARQQVSQYQPISKVAPDYPRRALDRAIEGDCTVQYDVTPNGRVNQPSIVSCDDPLFERPSLRAAAAFRYEPHRVNGQPVTVPGVRNTFRYRIESR